MIWHPKQLKYIATICSSLFVIAAANPSPLTQSGSCQLEPDKRQQCIDTTPCKVLPNGLTACLNGVVLPENAIQIPAKCWSYKSTFACVDSSSVDNCSSAPWMKQYGAACQQTNVVCDSVIPENGKCAAWRYTYSCETSPAQTAQVLQCSSTALGVNLDMPTPVTAKNSPVKAAAMLEAARQISTYSECTANEAIANPDGCLNKSMFNGVYETCTKGYYGLKNCCVSQPGGQTNAAVKGMLMGQGAQVAKFAGEKAIDTASPYVFDAMYSAPQYTQGMILAMTDSSSVIMSEAGDIIGTNFASGGLSLGAYGFTFGTGTFTGSMGSIALAEGSWGYVSFNPYVFAAVVAIQVVQTLAQCEQSEQLLGMHKGQNLSVKVKEECVQKVPVIGTCIKWQEGWCSYNGAFGKILGTQGRAQLGLGLDQSCTGLTVGQLQKLNWDALDLSEFTSQIAAQATKNVPNSQTVSGTYNQNLNAVPVTGVNTNTSSGLGYPANYQSP